MHTIKPIDGCEPYFICADGRVFKKTKWRGMKEMKPERTRLGYMRIGFVVNGERKRFLVHTLVARAFLDRPEWATEVNHKDGNKENNDAENLEWSTRSKNVKHAFETGLIRPMRGEANRHSKLTEADVRQIKQELRNPYPGIRKALANRYGVVPEAIDLIKLGRNWAHVS